MVSIVPEPIQTEVVIPKFITNYNYADVPVNINVPRFQIINTSQSNDTPSNENAMNTDINNGEEVDNRSEVNIGRNTNENRNGDIQSISDNRENNEREDDSTNGEWNPVLWEEIERSIINRLKLIEDKWTLLVG